MKSEFAQKYNHDLIADDYDENVSNENNPVRRGYLELLKWVAEKTQSSKRLIDLGCWTGNTVNTLSGNFEHITCVDISENMLNLAREKLKGKPNVSFIKNDLLWFFDEAGIGQVDTIISTYAIHHLIQVEKHQLFQKIYDLLPKNWIIVFGDLMFKNKDYENEMKKKYPDLIEDFDDEFYWYVEEEVAILQKLGFTVEVQQFSDLSWGIFGEKQ